MNAAVIRDCAIVAHYKAATAARYRNVRCYMAMYSYLDSARDISKVVNDRSVTYHALLRPSDADGFADDSVVSKIL